LQKKLYDGDIIETCKLKGFKKDKKNKLSFDKMDKLMQGYYKELDIRNTNKKLSKKALDALVKNQLKDLLIHQDQIQFVSPLTSHISENDKMEVKKNVVNKWFKVGYSKGNIMDDGYVKPLVWKNNKWN